MAKRPAKKKKDNLTIALEQLTTADKESARAIRLLWLAIMAPIVKPVLTKGEFKIGKKPYHAKLSSYQWETILGVVDQNGDVLSTVMGLLSDLTQTVSGSACGLMDKLNGESHSLGKQSSPLGCCEYDGQTKPLTQAQCKQYISSSWDPTNPTCTHGKP